jgi:hypothetical protein
VYKLLLLLSILLAVLVRAGATPKSRTVDMLRFLHAPPSGTTNNRHALPQETGNAHHALLLTPSSANHVMRVIGSFGQVLTTTFLNSSMIKISSANGKRMNQNFSEIAAVTDKFWIPRTSVTKIAMHRLIKMLSSS